MGWAKVGRLLLLIVVAGASWVLWAALNSMLSGIEVYSVIRFYIDGLYDVLHRLWMNR